MNESLRKEFRTKGPIQYELLGPDLTREETANWLRCSLGTVDELVNRGVLKSYKLGSDRRAGRRIRRDSVVAIRNGEVA